MELSLQVTAEVPPRGLRQFSIALMLMTFGLIGLGGLVNSTGSGLSVPDWPTTYGQHLFLYPISEWRGGILYEHTHRLVAAVVGLMSFVLVLWSWLLIREPRYQWVRNVALVAFVLVVLQGLLGGLTVLYRLPTLLSASHAVVAQSFFACTVLLVVGLQAGWYRSPSLPLDKVQSLAKFALFVWLLSFGQILFGALTRHTYSALAIPDFPLVFGGIFPPTSALNGQVLIHYMHRLLGFVLAAAMLLQGWLLWSEKGQAAWVRWLALGGAIVVIGQILLGGWLVWSYRAVFPTTLHVIVGTALWAVNTALFFQLWRWRWLSLQGQ
ncbi:MAG: COX15/CtaA family protein [Candidatus Kapabacteria bacterium]|nr:COX15/CtaA family protein [Candidatus Kapabacteria bacterium]MDW8012369.1 COX15/CtaA family protein [Bacteroidota bacterium]